VRLGWMRRGRRVGLRDCGPVCLTVSVMKDDGIAGDEPLADGMHIAVRVRRDFTVTDAGRLLAAARAAYVQVNSGTTADEAEAVVTSAADAIFIILESSGLLGSAADRVLAAHAGDGLEMGGWRAQVTVNELRRLPAGPRGFEDGDVFALPAGT
jgi:hypothetical protein